MWNDRLFEKMENILEQYRRVAEKQRGYDELLNEDFECTLPLPKIELEKPKYKEMPIRGKKVSERPGVAVAFVLSLAGYLASREMQASYFSIAIMGLSVLVFIISCVLLFSGRESDEVFAAKVRATEDFNKKIDEEYEREYEIKLAPLKAIYDEQRQYEFEKWNEDHKFDLSLYKDALTKEKNAFDRLCEDAGIPERYRNEESLTGLCSFLKSRPEATLDEAFSYLERKPENSSERSWHSTTTEVQSAGLGPEFDAIFDNPFFRDPEGFIAKAGYTESSDLSDELAAKIINKTAKMMNKIAAAENISGERHTTTTKTTTRTTTSASNVTFIDPRKPRN